MEKQRGRSISSDATDVAEVPLNIVEVGLGRLDTIRRLNVEIFDDAHIIKTFDRDELLVLLAHSEGAAVGFKIGYQLNATTFTAPRGASARPTAATASPGRSSTPCSMWWPGAATTGSSTTRFPTSTLA